MTSASIVTQAAVQRTEGHLAFSHEPLGNPGEPGSKLTDREMSRLMMSWWESWPGDRAIQGVPARDWDRRNFPPVSNRGTIDAV